MAPDILAYAQVAVGIALAVLTFFLAKYTARMADNMNRPNVVASLEPGRWEINFFDLFIANTGNAVAFDIQVAFEPPLQRGEGDKRGAPLQAVSMLRPGQSVHSFVARYDELGAKKFRVTISWLSAPEGGSRTTLSYDLDIAAYETISHLKPPDPLQKIGDELRNIANNTRNR